MPRQLSLGRLVPTRKSTLEPAGKAEIYNYDGSVPLVNHPRSIQTLPIPDEYMEVYLKDSPQRANRDNSREVPEEAILRDEKLLNAVVVELANALNTAYDFTTYGLPKSCLIMPDLKDKKQEQDYEHKHKEAQTHKETQYLFFACLLDVSNIRVKNGHHPYSPYDAPSCRFSLPVHKSHRTFHYIIEVKVNVGEFVGGKFVTRVRLIKETGRYVAIEDTTALKDRDRVDLPDQNATGGNPEDPTPTAEAGNGSNETIVTGNSVGKRVLAKGAHWSRRRRRAERVQQDSELLDDDDSWNS